METAFAERSTIIIVRSTYLGDVNANVWRFVRSPNNGRGARALGIEDCRSASAAPGESRPRERFS